MTIFTREYKKLKNGQWQVVSILPSGKKLLLEILDELPFEKPAYTSSKNKTPPPAYGRQNPRRRKAMQNRNIKEMISSMKKAKVDRATITSMVKARKAYERSKEGG